MTVTALEPHVQLLNVLLVIFLVEPPPVAPSKSVQPAIVVAPVRVMFEKLLFCSFLIVPETEDGLVVVRYRVTVPPAPPLLKAVTIELLFAVTEPPVGSATLFAMNVALPVVFTFRLVNVLLLMFWESVAAVFWM
ncbi:MAG: hypothetical protein ACJ74W_11375 [Pyrinomonadaceae bacterium]